MNDNAVSDIAAAAATNGPRGDTTKKMSIAWTTAASANG